MYMVSMNIVYQGEPAVLRSGAGLRTLLWAGVQSTDQIEHIYAKAGPEQVQVVLFVQADTRHEADITAYRVCARACARLPGAYPDS